MKRISAFDDCTILKQQVRDIVTASLNNYTVLQHQNIVNMNICEQTMGNDDRGRVWAHCSVGARMLDTWINNPHTNYYSHFLNLSLLTI